MVLMFGKNVIYNLLINHRSKIVLYFVKLIAQKSWENALKDCGRLGMSLVNLQDPKLVKTMRELTKSRNFPFFHS
jgi:hypothetical protein